MGALMIGGNTKPDAELGLNRYGIGRGVGGWNISLRLRSFQILERRCIYYMASVREWYGERNSIHFGANQFRSMAHDQNVASK